MQFTDDLVADVGTVGVSVTEIRTQHQLVEVLDPGVGNDVVVESLVTVDAAEVGAIGLLGCDVASTACSTVKPQSEAGGGAPLTGRCKHLEECRAFTATPLPAFLEMHVDEIFGLERDGHDRQGGLPAH